jgi:hypothetical protein
MMRAGWGVPRGVAREYLGSIAVGQIRRTLDRRAGHIACFRNPLDPENTKEDPMARIETKERKKAAPAFPAEPQAEHLWLEKFLGEWESEGEVDMGPERGSEETTGEETVRSLGGLWVVGEGRGSMPDAGEGEFLMILGFDPVDARFIGTWTGSMMTHQWVYEGDLDDDADELTLYAEGPDMSGSGGTAMYKDVHTFTDEDHRVLRSYVQEGGGEWRQFVEVHHRRRRQDG